MDNNVLSQAISKTGIPEQGATDTTEQMPEEDGTVTIPSGILPAETKEGDIVQFEYITETDAGCVLKPVESRIKQPGAGKENVKASGSDNSSVGVQPDKSATKPIL